MAPFKPPGRHQISAFWEATPFKPPGRRAPIPDKKPCRPEVPTETGWKCRKKKMLCLLKNILRRLIRPRRTTPCCRGSGRIIDLGGGVGIVSRWVASCRDRRRVGRCDDGDDDDESWRGDVPWHDRGYRLPLGPPRPRRRYAPSLVSRRAWERRMMAGPMGLTAWRRRRPVAQSAPPHPPPSTTTAAVPSLRRKVWERRMVAADGGVAATTTS